MAWMRCIEQQPMGVSVVTTDTGAASDKNANISVSVWINLTRLQDTVLIVRRVRFQFFDLSLCYSHENLIRNCCHLFEWSHPVVCIYGVLSKIFRTGSAIYTAVVVARSTGSNRPNREFHVLLQRFVATAWRRTKTSPRTLPRIDLAASLW
jgi:hypothetical protein